MEHNTDLDGVEWSVATLAVINRKTTNFIMTGSRKHGTKEVCIYGKLFNPVAPIDGRLSSFQCADCEQMKRDCCRMVRRPLAVVTGKRNQYQVQVQCKY